MWFRVRQTVWEVNGDWSPARCESATTAVRIGVKKLPTASKGSPMTTPPPGRWKQTDESSVPPVRRTINDERSSADVERQSAPPRWIIRPEVDSGYNQYANLPPCDSGESSTPKSSKPSEGSTRSILYRPGIDSSNRRVAPKEWSMPPSAAVDKVASENLRELGESTQIEPNESHGRDVEIFGNRVSPPMLSGGIGAIAAVSFLIFCSRWLNVEMSAPMQLATGTSGDAVNGFGFFSEQSGGNILLLLLAFIAMGLLVFGGIQVYRKPLSRAVAISVTSSGIFHLVCAIAFFVVGRAGNDEFTDESMGRLANITPAGGWYVGVLMGVLLVGVGIVYFFLIRRHGRRDERSETTAG